MGNSRDGMRPAVAEALVPAAGVMVQEGEALLRPAPSAPRREHGASKLGKIAYSFISGSVASWLVVDAAIALFAMYLGHNLSPYYFGLHFEASYYVGVYGTFAFAVCLSGYALGLYERASYYGLHGVSRCFATVVIASIATTVLLAWVMYIQVGRYVIFTASLVDFGLMAITRMAVWLLAGQGAVRILFVGSEENLARLLQVMSAHAGMARAIQITGHVCPAALRNNQGSLDAGSFDKVVVEDDDETIAAVLDGACAVLRGGSMVKTQGTLREELFGEVDLDAADYRGLLGGGWCVGIPPLNSASAFLTSPA